MSIIPASALTSADLRSLGNNVLARVRSDPDQIQAVNRSLLVHGEHVQRLYRRAGLSRAERLGSQA